MLQYISKNDLLDELKDSESENKDYVIALANTIFSVTDSDYLSTLSYDVLDRILENYGTIDELLNNPTEFFNCYKDSDIRSLLYYYEKDILFYLDKIISLDAYCPELPDYDDLRQGIDGLQTYLFCDVIPCIFRYLFNM